MKDVYSKFVASTPTKPFDLQFLCREDRLILLMLCCWVRLQPLLQLCHPLRELLDLLREICHLFCCHRCAGSAVLRASLLLLLLRGNRRSATVQNASAR